MNSFTRTQPHSFLYNIQQQSRSKSDYKQRSHHLAATNSGEITVTKKHFKDHVFCHITFYYYLITGMYHLCQNERKMDFECYPFKTQCGVWMLFYSGLIRKIFDIGKDNLL